MVNVRAFEVTQKFDTNGSRVTTLKDIRNDKKVKIRNISIDDAKIIAVEFLKEKNIEVNFEYEEGKKLFLLSLNFTDMIK